MHANVIEDDLTLLKRYVATADADAFASLTRRHAPMVYSVALRVTGSAPDAEDIAQSCMIELARKAGTIRSSLVGWLHLLATHRAQNLQRDKKLRRERETRFLVSETQPPEATWDEIAPKIDAALAELPAELREPLIRHYLQNQSQAQIASDLKMSQPTVSRRLQAGVARLRESLGTCGLMIPLASLETQLLQAGPSTVPATLNASLGKLALAGLRSSVSNSTRLLVLKWASVVTIILGICVLVRSHFGGSTVQLMDVQKLQWGAPRDGSTTFIGCLAAAARSVGTNTSYSQLMGDSALAFATRWYRDDSNVENKWQGLSAFGDDHADITAIESSVGLRIRRMRPFGNSYGISELEFKQLRGVIDAGHAAVIQDGKKIHASLLIGYDANNRFLVARYGADPTWESLTQVGGVVLVEKRSTPLARHDAVRQAIRKAVKEWSAPPQTNLLAGWTDPGGVIFHGARAWDEWSIDTRQSMQLDEALARQIWVASWWNFDILCDARFQAAKYLTESASEFTGDARAAMLRAAAQYQRLDREGLVDSVYKRSEGPFTAKTFADWTIESREAELKMFQQVCAIDEAAMRELTEALRAIEQQAN